MSNKKEKTARPQRADKPKIGITFGDMNGIGPETIIKVTRDTRLCELATIFIYGSGKALTKYSRLLDIEDFSYHQYNPNSYVSDKKPNVVNCWQDNIEVEPGTVSTEAGRCAYLSIAKSTEDLESGFIDAVVTSPINKNNIHGEDFDFPGHTGYYASKFGEREPLMMMVSPKLRVGVVTDHIPLEKVAATLTKQLVTNKLKTLLHTLEHDFGIGKPRVAVLGVNPHAGENGLLGDQEEKVINPAVTELKKKGNLVFGPFPADGFFGAMQHAKFDAVLAMYHDQGLVPFKTLAFQEGVNFTGGLSVVRTSPDHGTAYDIAGKGVADETSLREAIYLACDVVRERQNKVDSQLRRNPELDKKIRR